MDKLELYVNEKRVIAESAKNGSSDLSLASFLRDTLNLTGTKISCGVGGCGACTVMISRYCSGEDSVKHYSVNACLTPLYSLHGCHILTVEGLSDTNSYHEIQQALALGNATQCGFCSPGVVMSMFGMQAEASKTEVSVSKVKSALQGNLCRCTGYRPMLEAFIKRSRCNATCKKAEDGCCQSDIEDAGKGSSKGSQCIENLRALKPNTDTDGVLKRIEEILKNDSYQKNLNLKKYETSTKTAWIVPTSVADLKKVLNECKGSYKIVSGATSDEFWKSLGNTQPLTVIDVSKVEEMRRVEVNEKGVKMGASLTISEVQEKLQSLDLSKSKILKGLLQMIEVYGSGQVRRAATIGGSLSVTSTASDVQTAFLGFDLTSQYVQGLAGVKVLESVYIPFSDQIDHAWYGKIRRRKDFDLALVNAAIMHKKLGDNKIEISYCFGGTLLKRFVHKFILSEKDAKNFHQVSSFIESMKQKVEENTCPEQLKLNPAIASFVETSALSLVKKCALAMRESESAPASDKCSRIFRSTRILTKPDDNQQEMNLVHREVPHASAIKHVTGEAKYCDDTPKLTNELELAFVHSTKPYAKILKVDFAKALEVEGVVGIVTHEDVLPGRNKFGLVEQDEEIFASERVTCYGQIIAGVVANSRSAARNAAKLVQVEYEDLHPVIFTNEDAIKHNAFYDKYDLKLTKGNCKEIFGKGYNEISGEEKVGSQEHFYMETQSCIVIPKGEEQELEIISSTQNPSGVQMQTATVLNIPAHRIVVKVKRVGGGFGGKESRCIMIALPAAIAAQKFGRPVRCILSREADMQITGHRATYLTRHKMAFDEEGRLLALQIRVYIGAGNSIDVSMAEIERVALNIDNAYNIPNLDFKGYVCKTNHSSNTVFRGTGGPQATFLIENIIDTIATYLKKDPCQVRSLQIYNEGDFTPYGQSLKDSTVLKCWNECLKSSEYRKKREEVEAFNRENSFKKRGISVNPINYGVGYTVQHLNQGAALVHIYTDGTVLVSHSGVEIGQGVHTKMIQIATSILKIPGGKIRIMETATDKVPNCTPSSASMTTDLSGGAVMNACQKLAERLEPYRLKYPEGTWEDIVVKAYEDRVSLSATGFYKVPEMGDHYDASEVQGNPWSYFSS